MQSYHSDLKARKSCEIINILTIDNLLILLLLSMSYLKSDVEQINVCKFTFCNISFPRLIPYTCVHR